MSKKFMYGIAEVRKDGKTVGYIEKGSFEWGGTAPESTDIEAEQVPDAPVLTLASKNGTVAPKFNLIQLDYETLEQMLGGTLVGSEDNYTGWKAPTSLIQVSGAWEIDTVSGQTIKIPNGTVMGNLGGNLTLTEVSKIAVELKVNKPEDGGAPFEIVDKS